MIRSAIPHSTVLVLDADQRSALAVVRSLGRAGITVHTASARRSSLAASSKYSSEHLIYPSPAALPAAFEKWLSEIGASGYCCVIPCTDLTVPRSIEMPKSTTAIRGCLPNRDAYHRLSDKWDLFNLGRQLGVPMPATTLHGDTQRPAGASPEGPYPRVIKPRRSRMLVDGQLQSLPVRSASDPAELAECLTSYPRGAELLVQQTIQGRGFGISTVCDRGTPLFWFAHMRLREKPPSGGVSTLCESIAPPMLQVAYCQRLVNAVGWHGPAMFEFKGTPDGEAALIEVNGRLWGSVQLAIDCGIDVPIIMYRLAMGDAVPPVEDYVIGRRLRWWIGDLGRLYMLLSRKRPPGPRSVHSGFRRQLVPHLRGRTISEDWRYGDWGPFLRQVCDEILAGVSAR